MHGGDTTDVTPGDTNLSDAPGLPPRYRTKEGHKNVPITGSRSAGEVGGEMEREEERERGRTRSK